MAEQKHPKEEPKEPKESSKMKRGEYTVHVFLEEARGLIPLEEGSTIDPIVTFTVWGKTKKSTERDDISSGATICWGEHFFFNNAFLEPLEAESSKILIEVRDHKFLLKDSLVGNYELDLSYVYRKENHSLLHQWIALCNPESDNFQQVRGHLKLGICVQAEGDSDVDLTVKEKDESKDSDILLPPQVHHETRQIVVRILKADNLPQMDYYGTIDAFCEAEFAGAKVRTKKRKADENSYSAFWYEDLYLPVSLPNVTSNLILRVWDHDIPDGDDLVGTLKFLYEDIVEGLYENYFWMNIYGAPKQLDNEEATKMNTMPELASAWRGRILLSIKIKKSKKPKLQEKPIEDPTIGDFYRENFEELTPYEIRCQVFSGVALPEECSEYSVQISWCHKSDETDKVETKNKTCNWFSLLKRKIVKIPKYAENTLPDVIVYLKSGSDTICYTRLDPLDWTDLMASPKWIALAPDKAVGKVSNSWEGGYVRIRFYVGIFNDLDENLTIGRWNVPPKRKKGVKLNLVANVFQCRQLPAADSDGKSDPYVKVYCCGVMAQTEVKENTLNPMWYKTLNLEVEGVGSDEDPPVLVYVMDSDDYTSDDLIGVLVVPLSDAARNKDSFKKPTWHKLDFGKSSTGEILFSMNLYDREVPEYSIVPECFDSTVEINCLGLRNLEPAVGFLPVNKPFVKFDMNSLQIPGENLLVRNVETQPKDLGPNANIDSVIKFSCRMPVEEIFSPILTCTVYDNLFKGLSQPIIGTFNINLGEYFFNPRNYDQNVPSNGQDFQEIVTETQKPTRDPLINSRSPARVKTNRPSVEKARKGAFVIWPSYSKSKNGVLIEQAVPDENYIQIGYDRKEDDRIMHYRYVLDTPLEETEYIESSPFEKFEIRKGQDRGVEDNWLLLLSSNKDSRGNPTTVVSAGTFKGQVRVSESKKASKTAKSTKHENSSFDKIRKMLLVKTDVVVRVYVIDAFNLPPKDRNSHSDPYLKVKLGNQTLDSSDEYISDDSNPSFLKMFELKTTLPGASILKISVWDYDPVVSDDKIGSTLIDLEDRFFSTKWRSLKEKPIEKHELYHKLTKQVQGSLRFWLELWPANKEVPLPRDLTPRPPAQFEVRLIVWGTKGIENYDVEATSDIYVRCWVNDCEPKETDTHYRCQDGKASFNWRIKFPISLPTDNCICNLQVWDRDILDSNDFIGDVSFKFEELAKFAFREHSRAKKISIEDQKIEKTSYKKQDKYDKFWVPVFKQEEGEREQAGEVQISFELVPQESAEACKVGEGRDEPNIDPYLPPPIGRFEWSWNPCTLIARTCGPAFRMKLCFALCTALCCYLAIMLFPTVLSAFIVRLIRNA